MSYKEQIVERIEKFYVEIIEEFKEAELRIMEDSKFRSIFKKKDYDGNIKLLRECKRSALGDSVSDIKVPDDDAQAKEVKLRFEDCILNFNKLCDAHIQLQEALNRKAAKQPLKFSEYNDLFKKMQEKRNNLNEALHELDIVYTDYTYDENEDPYTFLD